MDVTADRLAAIGGLLIGISGILSTILNARATRRLNGTPKRVAKIEKAIDVLVEREEMKMRDEMRRHGSPDPMELNWLSRLESIRADMRSGGH